MQGCLDASSRVVPRCVGTFHLERCSYASLACDTGSNLLSECAAYARLPAVHGEGRARLGPGLGAANIERLRGTRLRLHNNRSQRGTVTWIVTDYRPTEGRVSYARLVQDSNIGIVDVSCTEPASGGTVISVRYTLTAVSEAGESFVTRFLADQHYTTMIEEWRVAISKVLRLPPGP